MIAVAPGAIASATNALNSEANLEPRRARRLRQPAASRIGGYSVIVVLPTQVSAPPEKRRAVFTWKVRGAARRDCQGIVGGRR